MALADRTESCSSINLISVPTLILCGREDLVTPPEKSQILHQDIKNSVLHIIDEAGHMSNLEQAEEFNNFFTEFINKNFSI